MVVRACDRLEVAAHLLQHPDHRLLFLARYAGEKAPLKLPTPLLKLDRRLPAVLCQRDERESVVGRVEPTVDRVLRFKLLDETSDRCAVDAEPPAQLGVADLTVLDEKQQQLTPAFARARGQTERSPGFGAGAGEFLEQGVLKGCHPQ